MAAASSSLAWLACLLPGLQLEVGGPEVRILGQVQEVPVRIRAPAEGSVAGRPLRLSVNVGRFGPIRRVEPGVYESTYRPPDAQFPQVAFVAAWRETGPDAEISFFRIPLHARTEVPVRARSGASVSVQVGDQIFGPVVADGGRARIPIVVPPGTDQVLVVSRLQGRESQATVSAGIPPYNRLTLAASPYKIPSDGQAYATIHAFYDREGGLEPEQLRLRAPGGRLNFVRRQGQALIYRFVPNRTSAARTVRVEGEVRRDPASKAFVDIELGLPMPERVAAPIGAAWRWDGRTPYGFTAFVTDRLGLGVDGLDLVITSTPAVQGIATVRPLGEGQYRVQLEPQPATPFPPEGRLPVGVRVRQRPALGTEASIPLVAAPWPTDVQVRTAPARPEAQPRRPVEVEVQARDASGQPHSRPLVLGVAEGGELLDPLFMEAPGRYRARVQLTERRRSLPITVSSTVSGAPQVQAELRFRRRRAPFAVGPRVGPLVSEGLFLLGGLGWEVRPGWLQDRFKVVGRVSYWQREERLGLPTLSDSPALEARLGLLPISLGVGYELWSAYRASLDFVALGTVAPGLYQAEVSATDQRRSETLVFGGFEMGPGLEFSGFTLDFYFGLLRVDEPQVVAPDFYGGAALGYRFGL